MNKRTTDREQGLLSEIERSLRRTERSRDQRRMQSGQSAETIAAVHRTMSVAITNLFREPLPAWVVLTDFPRSPDQETRLALTPLRNFETPRDMVWVRTGSQPDWRRKSGFAENLTLDRLIQSGRSLGGQPISRELAEKIVSEGIREDNEDPRIEGILKKVQEQIANILERQRMGFRR